MVKPTELRIKLKVDTDELDAALVKYHQHKWVFDATEQRQSGSFYMPETWYVYHCDGHDAPLVVVTHESPTNISEPIEYGHNCLRDD